MTHRYASTIDELLGDQLIQAVMRADRVDPRALRTLLDGAANRIAGRRERRSAFHRQAAGRKAAVAVGCRTRMRAPCPRRSPTLWVGALLLSFEYGGV